jgi:cytochrome c-type biogenesis protein CcmH
MKTLALTLLLTAGSAAMATEIREFQDPAKQTTYENLIKDLRCLVCQNQSLADSDADLAKDLRTEVYNIIQSGKNEDEAIKFLTDRYGDFVLYRPPVNLATSLLWLGPFALLISGGYVAWRLAKQRNRSSAEAGLSQEEQQRLQKLKSNIED